MFRMFKSWCSPSKSDRKRAAWSVPSRNPKPRTCLSVEALEDRLVLSPAYFQMFTPTNVVQAGGSISLTVKELNSTTNQLISSGGVSSAEVSFGSSPLETVPLSGGIGQTTLTLTKAETAELFATNGAITGSTPFITVEPGPVSQFLVSPAASQETAGTPFKVTVTAEDQYGNTVTTANLNPSLGASYGFPVLVSSSSWSQGVDTYTVAMDVAGSTSLTAARLAGSPAQIVTGSASITINPGPVTHFAVSTGSTEKAGTPFPVSITAEDAYNNTVTSYNQTPTITASYGHSVSVSGITWSKGVGTATVTLDIAGSTTLAATAGSLKGTSGSITVDPGSATHFAVSSGSQETVGASFPVSITAEDAYNNIVTSYNQTPTLTPSYGIPLSLQVAGIHWSSGVGTATVTLENPGTTTLTAAAGTVKGTSNSITVDAVTSTTPNQAGYISYDSPATAVGANWVQPAASGTGSASFWVGLSDSPNVEQIGTQVQIVNGSPQYSAWYELIPNNPTAVPITTTNNGTPFVVSPGDHIQAAVFFVSSSGSNSTFHLLLQDTPANGGPTEFFDIDQTMANVNQASAEWIAEAPTIGKTVATLPNFGQVTFTGAWATIGSTTGPVNDFSGIQALNIVQNNVQVTTTSNPPAVSNSLGYQEFVQPNALGSSSFTVTYGAVPTGQAPLQANLATAPVAGSSSASAGPSNVPASALKQSQGVMQPPVDNSTPVNQPAPLDALVATNQLANQDDVMPSGSDYSLNDVVDALFAQYALESHLGIGPLL